MSSTRALDNVDARGRSFTAWRTRARAVLGKRVQEVKRFPLVARSIVQFVLVTQFLFLFLMALLYLPSSLQEYLVSLGLAMLSCVALVIVLLVFVRSFGRSSQSVTLGLANRLTISRFLLIVPTVALILHDRLFAALIAYALCSLTDVLDGIVARRKHQLTDIGRIMDPVADILSTFAVFAALLARDWLPVWVFAILIARYMSLAVGAVVLALRFGPVHFAATGVGKVAAVLQAIGAMVILALAASGIEWQPSLGPVFFPFLGLVFLAVIVSQVVVGVRHIRRGVLHARP